MKSSKERILRFLELKLDHGTGALTREPWNLRQMVEEGIRQNYYPRQPAGTARRFRRIRHGKIVQRGGRDYAAFLVVLADSDFVNASYENIQTGRARTFEKEENEGYRTEAHVVIDLEPEMRGTTQVYGVVIEESPGLSVGVIAERLGSLLRTAGKREMERPSGGTEKWRPVVSLDALACASLIDEIAQGELQDFSLVREHIQDRGLDEHGDLVQRRLTMQVAVMTHPEAGQIPSLLSRMRNIAFQQNFDKVRIRYTESGTKKTKTAVIDAGEQAEDLSDAGAAIEKLVARTRKITLSEPLNYDHEEVVDTLVNIAIDKLRTEREGR